MARKLVVEIVGDASSLERSFVTANRSSKVFVRDMEKAGRGAIAGTGLFKNFGRSLAFASGGFLAFSSASEFLTKSVEAARGLAVAQRQLGAQMKASGESFAANQGLVEQTAVAYEKLGFNTDEVIQSLTVLERGTGNINQALKLEGLTADIARAKGIDLASAGAIVAKVFGNQETALRRAVPGLDKNAHGWDLIREAQQKMAGQAAAGTTASERFNATLHNTQEIIGTALLPVLNKYLDQLSKWLDKMNSSGKLQQELNTFMANAAPIVQGLTDAMGGLAKAIGDVNTAWGKLPKPSGGWITSILQNLPGGRAAQAWLRFFKDVRGKGSGLAPGGGPVLPNLFGQDQLNAFLGPAPKFPSYPYSGPKPLTTTQRRQFFDANIARQLDRVQDLGLKQQLQRLRYIAQEVKDRIALTKDETRRNTLMDQYVQILRDEKSVQGQITDQIKQQNQLLKDRADAIKSAILNRMQAKQTGIENRQALNDALAQLRLERALGGPQGIRLAQRDVEKARFAIRYAALEAAPARLRGGTFTLGNVITINVHGNESPEAVARKVVAILQRHTRHSSVSQRGSASGTPAGQH